MITLAIALYSCRLEADACYFALPDELPKFRGTLADTEYVIFPASAGTTNGELITSADLSCCKEALASLAAKAQETGHIIVTDQTGWFAAFHGGETWGCYPPSEGLTAVKRLCEEHCKGKTVFWQSDPSGFRWIAKAA
ncbi:hypothetical protein EPO05_06730 [Patescibacteria group bacterium]|nr:MAG: hypothetical protein EPO05_06730 [Patescibacteria group bacterium]